jgi:outer membrane autotransporter protein
VNETVFVSGQLGYIWSDNDTTRNPGGLAALNAKGSYNADAFVAGLAVGRDYHTGHGTLVLTPKVSADYMHYSADSYTETGAGTANLTVDADSLNMFEIGLGVEAEWDIQNANGTHLMPSIGLGVRHDLIGDEFEATNKFAGGGSAFKVKGFDPAQTTFDAGLGVKYITDTNWTLSAGYDFEFKSDYSAHAGMVKASYKF